MKRLVIVGKYDALIPEMARVPFEPKEGAKFLILIGVGDDILDMGPGFFEPDEAIIEMGLGAVFDPAEIVPTRMSRERKKI